VSAITDMVAPVVLMTLVTIFGNGLITVSASIRDHIFRLNRERLEILRGPHGEMLAEDSLPPIDRERLTQIRHQMPVLMRRVRRVSTAILISWISIALLVLSVAAIAVAVTAHSEAFAFTALALVLAGVAGVFAAVATMVGPRARWLEIVTDETSRTEELG
jgi:Protein of unknown function (DUF2721)